MPPCDTTQINMVQHPNFSITINSPTKRHPSPPLPPQTIVTAVHTMLPTPTLTIRVAPRIDLAPGRTIPGADLVQLIRERMKTWQNPYMSEVAVRIEEGLAAIETVRKGKGGGKGKGRGSGPPSSS
eukprot:12414121-Karenia_brevis.AAC.1